MREKMGLDKIKSMFDLSGKVAVITGGSGGFGRAAAMGLAAYGADVVVTSRTLTSLQETVSEVETQGRKALAISCDVTDADSVAAMAKQVVDQCGQIDIMVTGAGIAARHRGGRNAHRSNGRRSWTPTSKEPCSAARKPGGT